MEGLSAVTARIGEIRSLLQPTVPAVASRGSASGTLTAAGTTAGTAAPTIAGSAPASFADALARAVVLPTPPAGAPAAPPAGMSVADLRSTYRNGQVPAQALSPIGHGEHRLAAPAATAFGQLEAAARRDGVTLGVTDSYRSYDAQVDVARRKGLYSQGGLAAAPGTSQHGWGLAVDLDLDARAQAWMRANGARFGFVEDTPREPWHWAFQA